MLAVTVVAVDVFEHPTPWLTVTLKDPEDDTLIDCVVAPFDHRYVAPEFAVNVTDPPEQKEVAPLAVIVAIGLVNAVTVIGVVLIAHPFTPVIVAEKFPDVVTLIACDVAPFDHK